jgi:hypothetical protein
MKTHRTLPTDRPSPSITVVTVLAAVALIAVVAIGLYVVVNFNAVFGFARYLNLAYGGWG